MQPEPAGFAEQAAQYETLDLPVLIDHMGRPNPAAGTDDPSLRKVIDLLRRGNFWVMLSLSEKISKAGKPWDDVIPIMRALIEAAPDRVIWASDWPHPVSTSQPPNEADLVELLYRATHDDAERKRILVDNPAQAVRVSSWPSSPYLLPPRQGRRHVTRQDFREVLPPVEELVGCGVGWFTERPALAQHVILHLGRRGAVVRTLHCAVDSGLMASTRTTQIV